MKVLIITYYWPPAGGSGVQRWLKFTKYLPNFDVEPIVYVPENPNYPTIDAGIEKEIPKLKILKKRIFNPQDLIVKKKTSGVANINKGGLLSWIRGNFFIPDAKIFWVKPSVKFLEKYIKEHQIDVIISSGPPHSIHLIANKLKQKLDLKWIADFRDPWTSLYYTQEFNLTSFAKLKNKKLEQQVLTNADKIITVSKTLKQELGFPQKTSVISNGYDDEVLVNAVLDKQFSLSHIGLLPSQSNPVILWEVLKEICQENKQFKNDLRIALTGNVSDNVIQDIKKNDLAENLELNAYVTHQKAILLQKQAQVLLLLIPKTTNSKGILTGKVFEYITSKRPIIAIGDEDGDLADILENTATGTMVGFENKNKLKKLILEYYNLYLEANLKVNPVNIEQYHRKNLTEKLANEIKNLK